MLTILSDIKSDILDGQTIDAIAMAAFDALNLSGEVAVELATVSEANIRAVNFSMRGIGKITDVLSFPYIDKILPFTQKNYPFDCMDGNVLAGSIIICTARARQQANKFGHGLKREMCYLFVHGLLHIFGYDHQSEKDKLAMRVKEEQILAACGLSVKMENN